MTITTRAGKGSALTHAEMDENLTDLRDIPQGKTFPKASGVGIKIDTASPDWGYHDLHGILLPDPDNANHAQYANYIGSIRQLQFSALNVEAFTQFHIPHDYAPGTDLFIHVHWSHDSTLVTGGSVTWAFELCYSKGHGQQPFSTPKVASVIQSASTTQYQHMVAETACSTSGGSTTQFDTDDAEVDGVVLCRIYLDSNDITVSGGGVPDPFVHFVDLHYQSTGLPTKQKSPNFYT